VEQLKAEASSARHHQVSSIKYQVSSKYEMVMVMVKQQQQQQQQTNTNKNNDMQEIR